MCERERERGRKGGGGSESVVIKVHLYKKYHIFKSAVLLSKSVKPSSMGASTGNMQYLKYIHLHGSDKYFLSEMDFWWMSDFCC